MNTRYTFPIRARLLGALLAAALLFSVRPASADALGVNYNGLLNNIDETDLVRSQTTWIRGFVDYFAFKSGAKDILNDPGLQKLADAHAAGYKTILSIKFNFTDKDFPTTPAGRDQELNFLNTLLTAVYLDCDIIVVGNEPFIESKPEQRDSRLVEFYKAAALKTKAYKDSQARKIPLYLGAYNNLWLTSWRTQAVVDLLAFTKNNTWLAGADLHLHHSVNSEIDGAFSYVSPRLASGQQILVTEFSLMKHWRAHNNDTIPSILATQYGRPASWKVYQYLNYALDNPVSRPEWVAFLQNSPWFETRKHYLNGAWAKFTSYSKFNIATYGMYQSGPATFTSTSDPWILNPIFVNQTVVPNPTTGENQFNYTFGDDFRAIQP